MGSLVKSMFKTKAGAGGLAGLGVTFSLALARHLLRRPGFQASADFFTDTFFHTKEEAPATPTRVVENAAAIAALFREKGLNPTRLAVDGVPGSGKSVLATVLAEMLGMEAVCLDHQNMDETYEFGKENAIYEHHRLLRTQNLDDFDALIYLDEPVAISKRKVLERKRGGYLVDVLDYALLKEIGDLAFAFAAGEPLAIPNSFTTLKLKPKGGFQDRELISMALWREGIDGAHFTKEEALFICAGYLARKGFKAYVNLHAFDKEMLTALSESLLLSGAAKPRR